MLLGIRSGKQRDVVQHKPEVGFFQVQVSGAGEVHQNLDHAIQTMDLAIDNVYMAVCVRVELLQFVAQQLQVKHDSVNRVLNFVCHSAGHATGGGNPP